jgi:hypothetical protein
MTPEHLEPRLYLAAMFGTGHDLIPNYAEHPDTVAVASGPWSSVDTWSAGVPTANSKAHIPNSFTVSVGLSGDFNADGRVDDADLIAWGHSDDPQFPDFLRWQQEFGATGGNAEVRSLLVDGALTLAPDSELTVGTLTTFGELTGHNANITFSPQVIDAAFDPEQFGGGLLALNGTVRLTADEVTPYVRLGQPAYSGFTWIDLATNPVGWKVGDEVELPDTYGYAPFAQREVRKIAALRNGAVILDVPLEHDHAGAIEDDGTRHLPHMVNLTRRSVLRSENPDVRAHGFFAADVDVELRNVAFVDMGRTRADIQLDSAKVIDGVLVNEPTNQIGRYPVHFHHLHHAPVIVGSVVNGSPKWGIAIHDMDHGSIKDNVIRNAIGAGIVTEDGTETGNHIARNFIIGSTGSGAGMLGRDGGNDPRIVLEDGVWKTLGDIGHEGAGIWLHGQANNIEGNIVANSTTGLTIWTRRLSEEVRQGVGLIAGNEVYASQAGFTFDGLDQADYVVADSTLWHVTWGVDISYSNRFTFDGLTLLSNRIGITTGFQHTFLVYVTGRDWNVQGFSYGAQFWSGFSLADSYFSNLQLNVAIGRDSGSPFDSFITNVTYGGSAPQLTYRWAPETPGRNHLSSHTIIVRSHDGVEGDDFHLLLKEQRPEFVMSVIPGVTTTPEAGLTNAELWAKYGVTLNAVLAGDDAVERDGIIGLCSPITGAA